MEHQILSDTENNSSTGTRSVWLLLLNGNAVRKTEIVLQKADDAGIVISAQYPELWAQATAVPDGVQAWYAYKQRGSNEFLNKLIFAIFVQVQSGADLATMLGVANMVLNEDPTQKAIYQALNQAIQGATEAQRNQFTALALTVAFGKLGQR